MHCYGDLLAETLFTQVSWTCDVHTAHRERHPGEGVLITVVFRAWVLVTGCQACPDRIHY